MPTAPRRRDGHVPASTTDHGPDPLLSLLHERIGGAVNMRGIRIQLLYATTRALELLHPIHRSRTVRFEGVEDVDVDGPFLRPWCVEQEAAVERVDAARLATGADSTGQRGITFIQVKSSINAWSWTQLRPVMTAFLEALRAATAAGLPAARDNAPRVQFELVLCADLRPDVRDLAQLPQLRPSEQHRLRQRFHALLASAHATPRESDALLDRLSIRPTTLESLQAGLRQELVQRCAVSTEDGLAAMEAALIGRALSWAQARTRVSSADVAETVRALAEAFAREHTFQSFGRHWVIQPSRRPDARPADFLDARDVRLGHIMLNLDVPRPRWIQRLGDVLAGGSACVIRAPSGQGKSTLAHRYAVDHWEAVSVIEVVHVAEAEHVAAIRDLLDFRVSVGLPVRVMVDVRFDTRRWSEVAAVCAALHVPLLVTVRAEDWHRYPLNGLTRFELVEPLLDSEEADGIFAQLLATDRVHPDVPSAAFVREQIGAPALLLEFVYLVTHGRMLEDRLADQLLAMQRAGQDPAQRAILRRAVTADVLGVPLTLTAILSGLRLRDDVQTVVQPLLDEFLIQERGVIRGMHWVRSQHLVRLLHAQDVPTLTSTVTGLLDSVPTEALAGLLATAFAYPAVQRGAVVSAVITDLPSADADRRLALLDALFETGERDFFEAHRRLFDDATALLGAAGPQLFSWHFLPALRSTVLSPFALLGAFSNEQTRGALRQLVSEADSTQGTPRGADLVRTYIADIIGDATLTDFWQRQTTQRLLHWSAALQVVPPNWARSRDAVGLTSPQEVAFTDLVSGATVLARLDGSAFLRWYRLHRDAIRDRARVELAMLDFQVFDDAVMNTSRLDHLDSQLLRDQSASPFDIAQDVSMSDAATTDADADPPLRLAIRYIISGAHSSSSSTANDQSVTRISQLHGLYPFAERFDTDGMWLLPEGMQLPFDDSVKRIPRRSSPHPWDVHFNVVWGTVIAGALLPLSSHLLLERWNAARSASLQAVRSVVALGEAYLRGRSVAFLTRQWHAVVDAGVSAQRALRLLPTLDDAAALMLQQRIPRGARLLLQDEALRGWANGMGNVVHQLTPLLAQLLMPDAARAAGLTPVRPSLLLHNVRETVDAVIPMHASFECVFHEVSDAAGLRTLNQPELEALTALELLVDGWLVTPISHPTHRPLDAIRQRRQRESAVTTTRLATLLQSGADEHGFTLVLPTGVHTESGVRSTAVGLVVTTLADAPVAAATLALALRPDASLVDTLWVVPLHDGARWGTGAYRVDTRHVADGGLFARLSDGSQVLADELARELSLFGVLRTVSQPIADLLGSLSVVPAPPPSVAESLLGLRAWVRPIAQALVAVRDAVDGMSDPARAALLRELMIPILTCTNALRTELDDLQSALSSSAHDPAGDVGDHSGRALLVEAQAIVAEIADYLERIEDLDCTTAVALESFAAAHPPDSFARFSELQAIVVMPGQRFVV